MLTFSLLTYAENLNNTLSLLHTTYLYHEWQIQQNHLQGVMVRSLPGLSHLALLNLKNIIIVCLPS